MGSKVNEEYLRVSIPVDMVQSSASFSHVGFSGSEEDYQFLGSDRMAQEDLEIGVMFLLQTTAGINGNFCLVYHFLSLYFKCQSTDWILKHMTLAKLLVVHLNGIPETLAALGLKQFTVHQ